MPAGWVAGDEMDGADPTLRRTVRTHDLGYVLQVAANRRVPHPGRANPGRPGPPMLPARAWQRHSTGAGSKGQRVYSWAWLALLPEDDGNGPQDAGQHHLLIRRNHATGEPAYLRCHSPGPVALRARVRVAGSAGASRSPPTPLGR